MAHILFNTTNARLILVWMIKLLNMQTGSGKTYTMLGDINNLGDKSSRDRGMTSRIFEFLFARIEAVSLLCLCTCIQLAACMKVNLYCQLLHLSSLFVSYQERESRREDNLVYTLKCSFSEIYNEQITDLLDPSSTNLLVRLPLQ